MRRLLVAVGSLAALVAAGVFAAGIGARTVSARAAPAAVHAPQRSSAARRSSPAPHRSPPAGGGHTCLVSVSRCSETPCIEYIQSATAAVARAPVPAVRLASPRCRSPKRATKVMRTPSPAPNFGLALPALAHKLTIRGP